MGVRNANENISPRHGRDFGPNTIPKRVGETEKVSTDNRDPGFTFFKNQGTDGEIALFLRGGVRGADATRDGEKRVGCDHADCNSSPEVLPVSLNKDSTEQSQSHSPNP